MMSRSVVFPSGREKDTNMKKSLIVVLLMTMLSSVYCTCPAVPEFVSINETDSDVVIVNVSSDASTRWTMEIKQAGSLTSLNNYQRGVMMERLNLTQTDDSMYITVTKVLDLQVLMTLLNVKVDKVLMKVVCNSGSGLQVESTVTITVMPINQFSPEFENAPYTITISEDAPLQSTIFRNYNVTDADVGPNEQLIYKINPYTVQEQDGSEFFGIPQSTSKYVTLKKKLDYDELKKKENRDFYIVFLNVTDENGLGRSKQTTLTVHVKNVDDLPPEFIYPGCGAQCLSGSYRTRTNPSYRGLLTIEPGRILAEDGDNLTHDILYSIIPETNGYHKSFTINNHSGEVTQINNVSESFILKIQATENTPNRHSSIAPLLVNIGGNVTSPRSEQSTASSETSLLVPLIVLAVLAAIVIAVFVILFLVYWNRFRRTVNPTEVRPASPATSEEILPVDKSESKTDLLSPEFLPTPTGKNNRLPPLEKVDMSTETHSTKKRSRRRKKRKEPEIFDGTREYEREADPEFFEASDKSKIKRSTRSIKENQKDPAYWITVPNEGQE